MSGGQTVGQGWVRVCATRWPWAGPGIVVSKTDWFRSRDQGVGNNFSCFKGHFIKTREFPATSVEFLTPLATAGWLLCVAKFHNPQVCISLQQCSGLHTSWDIVLYWESKGTAKIEAQWIICSEIPNNSHNTKLP